VAPPVFKTGLAGLTFAGRFDSFPPPPYKYAVKCGRCLPAAPFDHHQGRKLQA
jgi:hypothetical protein